LSCYFEAIEKGDSEAVDEIYWRSSPENSPFYLPGPINLSSYDIQEKRTHESDLDPCEGMENVHPDSCKTVPLWAKAGTVKLDVSEEFESGDTGMYTYFVRLIDGEWYLVSHYAWDGPD